MYFHVKGKGNENVKALTKGRAVSYTESHSDKGSHRSLCERVGSVSEEERGDRAEGAELDDEDDEVAQRRDGSSKEGALPPAEGGSGEDGEEEEEGEDGLDASRHEDEGGGERERSQQL